MLKNLQAEPPDALKKVKSAVRSLLIFWLNPMNRFPSTELQSALLSYIPYYQPHGDHSGALSLIITKEELGAMAN